MRLKTIGRHSGNELIAILGYYEDGPNLVTMAMNGWADGEPAWWLNLQAHPDATVDLKDGPRAGADARRRVTNGRVYGPAGARWGTTSTPMPAGGHPSRRSSCWNRGLKPVLTAIRGSVSGATLGNLGIPEPGGWNRFTVEVSDLAAAVERLRQAGVHFRDDIVALAMQEFM